MGQFGRFASIDDMPSEPALVAMVKEAMALNESGVKVARKRTAPRPTPRTPSYMLSALEQNAKALAAWTAFPPSHKREYIEWITEAKRDETRQRRLGQAIEMLAEGKTRNWKYT